MNKQKYIAKIEIEAADEQTASDMAADLVETTAGYFSRAEVISVYAKADTLSRNCS